jgi:hypothetical protein
MIQVFLMIVCSGVAASQLSLALLGKGDGLDWHWAAVNSVMRAILTISLFIIILSLMLHAVT